MSNLQAEVTLPWADGEYTFRLTVKGILELEEKCNAALTVIFARISGGTYFLKDVTETLRISLIGGGTSAADALKLVDRYAQPFAESAPIARAAIGGVLFGFEVAPLGKGEAAPMESPSASTPPPLSETPRQSVSPPMTLEEFHSGSWLQ